MCSSHYTPGRHLKKNKKKNFYAALSKRNIFYTALTVGHIEQEGGTKTFSAILITLKVLQFRTAYMGRVKRIWYLSPMRAAKVQVSLCIRAISPEPQLLAHTSSESRGTIRQEARSLAPLNGWACAVKICQDGKLKDTDLLDSAHIIAVVILKVEQYSFAIE